MKFRKINPWHCRVDEGCQFKSPSISGCVFELNNPLVVDCDFTLLLLDWGFQVYRGLDVKIINLMNEM